MTQLSSLSLSIEFQTFVVSWNLLNFLYKHNILIRFFYIVKFKYVWRKHYSPWNNYNYIHLTIQHSFKSFWTVIHLNHSAQLMSLFVCKSISIIDYNSKDLHGYLVAILGYDTIIIVLYVMDIQDVISTINVITSFS